MATTIKLKNGSGAPSASDLVQGEPALDLTNNRLYSENGSGSVVEIGTNPTSLSINGTAITATAAELNILDGVTSTASELNILDGVTATTAELNIMDGVTSTTAELNILDGVTSTAAELNILDGVTSTAAELNILDGVTSTAAELNILDGVTATASELNVLDGVTAFLDEDNFASNSATAIPSQQSVKAYVDANAGSGSGLSNVVDDTTPQLGGSLDVNGQDIVSVSNGNITLTPNGAGVVRLDGSNGVDISSGAISIKNSGAQSYVRFYCEASNAHYAQLQAPAHADFSGNTTLTLPATTDTLVGRATTDTLTNKTLTSPKINENVAVTATATELNILDGVTSTTAEINILDGVTSTAAELNILDGVTSTTAELNILDGVTATTSELNLLDGVTSTTAELNILDGVTSTASELNILDGVTSTATEINLLDGSSAGSIVNSKAVIYGSSGQVNATSVDVNGASVFGSGTTRLSVYSDANYSGIFNGSGLVSNESIYMGGSTVYFYTGGAERMRISAGNLLVGTTSLGGDGISILPRYSGSSTTSQIRFNRAATSTEGTAIVFMDNSVIKGSIKYTNSATSFNTSSDERLKENIVDAPAGNIDDIRVRSFDWKADGSHQTYGMVAQELVNAAPEAVTQGSDEDDTWQVDYSKLVPMMIKEIQDLKSKVAELEAK